MLTNTERLELRRRRMAKSPPILRGGFRPFFLGAAAWAISALAAWLTVLFGFVSFDLLDNPLAWHRHEMLFGFVGAAIAGFVLTAVPNWTGRLPIAGGPLAALFAVWLSGRLLPFVSPDNNPMLILVDGGFYLLLAFLLAREIIQSRNRNLPVVAIVLLFGAAGILDRLEMAGSLDSSLGWRAGLSLVVLLIAIIGGRIIPSFTRNWLSSIGARERLPTQPRTLDKVIIALTAAALLAWLSAPFSLLSAVLLSSASVAHFLRLSKWQGWRCSANALVWILHLAYLWLPVGLLLLAGAQVEIVPETAGIHAFSTGAMATMILAVMSRASLGHTGRALFASREIVASYILITIAAVLRVQAALSIGDGQAALAVAGAAWLGAFGLFLFRYGPILCAPRSDENTKEGQA